MFHITAIGYIWGYLWQLCDNTNVNSDVNRGEDTVGFRGSNHQLMSGATRGICIESLRIFRGYLSPHERSYNTIHSS